MKKKLSIIVCAYNAEKYINECIHSIIKQLNESSELIIINDGSNDSTESYLKDLESKTNKIRVIHKNNTGISDCRNLGISISNSEYITFLDSDDILVDNYIDVIFNELNKSPDMIEYDLFRFNDSGWLSRIDATKYKNKKTKYHSLKKTFMACQWFGCSRVYKKSLFDDVIFPINKRFEDMAIIPILYLKAKTISTIDIPLYGYRVNENGICHNNKLSDLSDVYEHMNNWFEGQESRVNNKLLVLACFRTAIFVKNINQKISGSDVSISKDIRCFIKDKVNICNLIYAFKFIPYLYFTKIIILMSQFKKKPNNK